MIFISGIVFWPENVRTAEIGQSTESYDAEHGTIVLLSSGDSSVTWKRMILLRNACVDARSLLSAILSQRQWKGIKVFVQTSCLTVLLCFQCIGDLDRLETLRRSFQELDDLIGSRADSLASSALPSTPVAPKRSATVPSSSTSKWRHLAPLLTALS